MQGRDRRRWSASCYCRAAGDRATSNGSAARHCTAADRSTCRARHDGCGQNDSGDDGGPGSPRPRLLQDVLDGQSVW